jgi:hypothetical protein
MATFYIHVEAAETEIVWWAETPDVAGLSLAAPTLSALRRLIDEASLRHLGPDTSVTRRSRATLAVTPVCTICGDPIRHGQTWDSAGGSA